MTRRHLHARAIGDSGAGHDQLLLTVAAAAARLSLGVRTVWRLVAADELKAVRCGRATRITTQSIERFIERGGAR